jgi:hypothetical protein
MGAQTTNHFYYKEPKNRASEPPYWECSLKGLSRLAPSTNIPAWGIETSDTLARTLHETEQCSPVGPTKSGYTATLSPCEGRRKFRTYFTSIHEISGLGSL